MIFIVLHDLQKTINFAFADYPLGGQYLAPLDVVIRDMHVSGKNRSAFRCNEENKNG